MQASNFIMILLSLVLFLTGSEAGADIYRYLNEEGVECFTDAPKAGNAVRILKERRAPGRMPKQIPAKHPPTEIAVKKDTQSDPPSNLSEAFLPVSGRISSPVGLRRDPIDGLIRDHKGVDIAVPQGTPVRPVAPGVVTFSGYRPGYGNTIMIRHYDGLVTIYAHNSTNLKSEGEAVDRSSTIAFSGSTGRSTGPHLHFEAWKNGVNLTATFVPGAASLYPPCRDHDDIRRTVEADGTLVFSNLP